jgi:putative flippase GtrA
MLESIKKIPAVAKLTSHMPPAQFGRYLVVGLWNTIFGYSSYALLTAVLTPRLPHAYILASVLSSLLNISVAFFGYKLFIFKTKGNYLREWLRCLLVYGGGMALGTALLPPTVFVFQHLTPANASAPYIAGALLIGVNGILSFLGHKRFSFESSSD